MIVLIHCWSCAQTFQTITALSEHHLDQHERPLPADAGQEPWEPPRLARWQPPNHKAQAARAWYPT